MKLLKYAIYAVLVLLALALAGVAIFAMTLDPNRHKGEIERLVQERTGRTLKLSGDLEVAFWPSLGARVNGVTLSERGGDGQFLALDSAHASVAVMPLLTGEVVVDGVSVSGLKARVVKDNQGRFNFQDLLGEPQGKPAAKPAPEKGGGGQPVKLDIAGVSIEDSAISYRDLATGQEFALEDLDLSVGRIADRADGKLKLSVQAKGKNPALDVRIELASGYRFDLPAQSFALSKLDAEVTGAAAGLTGITLSARGDVAADPAKNEYRINDLLIDFRGMQGKDALAAKLAAPSLLVAADTAKGDGVEAQFSLKGPERSAEALLKLAGVQGSAKALTVPQFSADVALSDPALPMKTLKIPVRGSLRADLEKQSAQADIKAKIDESTAQGKLGLAKFTPPAYRFDVNIDRLNVDRYFPPEKGAASGSGEKKAEKGGGKAETPVDLSGLKGLDASGRLQVGVLQARGLKLANVKAELRAANGRVEVAPHSAQLYGGSVEGALSAQADGNRITVREKLANVSIGPLLRDFAEVDRLEGSGNLSLDVAAAGGSVEAMKRALSGTAQLALRDGAIKGINIAQVLRKAKASLGRGEAQAAAETEKTDFSEMSASFRIKSGVARNDDLEVKAPLFRITGAGEIDIARSKIDYQTKVAVVGTAKGQDGADLAELAGVTVPVHLTGPLDNMKYDVDYGAVAADLAKTKAGDKLKKSIEKRQGKLEDRLKGLLNR